MSKAKKSTIDVQGAAITVVSHPTADFISLTDMAKKFGDDVLIYSWMRNRNTLEFIGIWEQIHNPAFKGLEFETFRNQAGLNSFSLTPKKWIESTGAIDHPDAHPSQIQPPRTLGITRRRPITTHDQLLARVCLVNKSMFCEGRTKLGQGDRGGGDPEGRAAEGNAGPARFPLRPEGLGRTSICFPDTPQFPRPTSPADVRPTGVG